MKDKSPPLDELVQCVGKHRHKSRYAANRELTKSKRNKTITARNKTLSPLMVYMCPFCDFWHIGHKPKMLDNSRPKQRNTQYHEYIEEECLIDELDGGN